MKKSLLAKLLIATLILSILAFAFTGCITPQPDTPSDNPPVDTPVDPPVDNPPVDTPDDPVVDKTALEAELALQIADQGDYTPDSYDAYEKKLIEAKEVFENADATQEAVDAVVSELCALRLALTVRVVEEVSDVNKSFRIVSGDTKEVIVSDFVNDNVLSSLTYEVKTSNAVLEVSSIVDGKFTVTAGDVKEATDVVVSIIVYYKGEKALTVDLSYVITNDISPVIRNEEIVKEYDIFDLANKENLVIDFAENVDNAGNLALNYAVELNYEAVSLEGTTYAFALGQYGEEYEYNTFVVTISCVVNGEEKTMQYTYKLGLKDTGAYRVANGNFENGLDGWTINTILGEKPFGGIDGKSTFWGEGYVMNNVGNYFSSYADGAEEYSHGTLTSPYFIAKGEYATYMLGGAGNHNVYITIENKNGEVLAVYRNTMFRDFTEADNACSVEERREMIGNTVFLANLVTYKVNISEYAGEEIRFVIHDYASSGWGVVFFDELNTYYTSADAIPEGAVLAENLLANKGALNDELALEVTEQGDYTADSFNAYLEKLAEAKALLNDVAVTQATVDKAVQALIDARLALAVRPIEAVEGVINSFNLISANDRQITISDYININGLNKVTFDVQTNSQYIAISAIADGRFTITAAEVSETTSATVSIIAYYNGEQKLVVDLFVNITNDLAPTGPSEDICVSYDLYYLENKEYVVIDFTKYIDNPGNLELTYSINGGYVPNPIHTYYFDKEYTEHSIGEMFVVTVSYVANGVEGSIVYIYTIDVRDTTAYRMQNGGFENGLDGWTVVGNIGNVSTDKNYWVNDPESPDGFAFGMDGDMMFSAYAPGAAESAVGTLTSPTFKVGGIGYITFKLGAAKDSNYVYVDIVDANTKEILARYSNNLWAERTNDIKSGCTLIPYVVNLTEFIGREVFVRISDNADSGYGLFFVDSFVTYYEYMSWYTEGYNDATPVNYELPGTIYDVFNGGFEMGNVQGWWNQGEIGVVTDANGYWGDNIPYEKVGDFLFTGVESFGADTMREGNRGTLTSSVFEIGGTGWISFKLGGGGNDLCYVQIIDAVTGEILVRYHQQAQQDAKLIQYIADLSAYIGRTARIQVVDQAENGWGCVSFDNVVTYYPTGSALPEGIVANNIYFVNYDVTNGSFENGLEGWTQNIWEGGAHNTLGWVESSEHDAGWYTKNDDRKDGNNLFTFCRPDGTNCENTRGELVSSTFTLKQNSFVSFRFGGAGTRQVRVELVRADGSVIATFYNEAPGKANTEMYAYFYQYTGETTDCFFRVVDDSVSNYGCFVVDDFRANLESAPEGFIAAIQ